MFDEMMQLIRAQIATSIAGMKQRQEDSARDAARDSWDRERELIVREQYDRFIQAHNRVAAALERHADVLERFEPKV